MYVCRRVLGRRTCRERKKEAPEAKLGSFAKIEVLCVVYCASRRSRSHTRTITTKDDNDDDDDDDGDDDDEGREIDGETWYGCPPSGNDSTL